MRKLLKLALLLFPLTMAAQVTVSPFSGPYLSFLNPNTGGTPCAGCQLSTYYAGTTNPALTYIDSTGTSTNQNPITLDGSGGAYIWTAQAIYYKFVLRDVVGDTLWSADNIPGGGSSGTGGSGTVGSGTAGQLAVYLSNGTTVTGASSVNGITVDGASPTAIGYTANLTSDAQAQMNALAPLANAALIGIPTAPTDSCNAHSTMLANEAYVAACATSGGGGAGTATQFAYYNVTGNTSIGTPVLTLTPSTSINATLPVAVTDSTCVGCAGDAAFGFGTARSVVAASATIAAPASGTAGLYVLPTAPATGAVIATNTAGVDALSIIQRMTGTPTFAGGSGSGGSGPSYTTPTCAVNSVPTNYACTDLAGAVSLTTGSSPAGSNATVFKITFSNTGYSVIPICTLAPADSVTDALPIGGRVHFSAGNSTSAAAYFLIGATGLTGATTYTWTYSCALPL
jgi:hypothetical protein